MYNQNRRRRDYILHPDEDWNEDLYFSTLDSPPTARSLSGLTVEVYIWHNGAILATLTEGSGGVVIGAASTVPVIPGRDSQGLGTKVSLFLEESFIIDNLPETGSYWEYQILLKASSGDPNPKIQAFGRMSFITGRPRS